MIISLLLRGMIEISNILYDSSVPDEDHAECIFSAISLVMDAGSTLDVPLDVDYLDTFIYDLFRS